MARLVSQEHLDALCPELRAVVADAVAAGNRVVETWTGFGDMVALAHSRPVVVALPDALRAQLRYRHLDDPRHWLGELSCTTHPGWAVVLPWRPEARQGGEDLGVAPVA